MKVNLVDSGEGLVAELLSKKYMINPSNEFFGSIASLPDIKVNLVSRKIELPADNKPDFRKYAKA